MAYLAAGAPLVWVVDPVERNVAIYRPSAPPELTSKRLADPLLPGFQLELEELFRRLDPR